MNNKIGIVVDYQFASQHKPPYPHPAFFSYENPLRIASILNLLEEKKVFENKRIMKLIPRTINESIIRLAHSQYHIDTIKRLSNYGNGILGEEVFISKNTFEIAKKAIGGTIEAIEAVLEQRVNQAFALVRPPGHHALRETASGLCIFNNIATSLLYLREKRNYKKKIAIIDIDDHFGDGIAQYFYEDPSVLYFSVHEFDFVDGDIGFITELGTGQGKGSTINFPIPHDTTDQNFLEFFDILTPILYEFKPDLIIVAAGFDMYFADQIGNCSLTSNSYYNFSKRILEISKNICDGKLVFVLEGGYNLIGLPYCVYAVLKALLNEQYNQPIFERIDFGKYYKKIEIDKIQKILRKLLKNHWKSIK
ncbi:MAG: histone deacetylase [Candidatus Lokiarchaeota archaeon]|nr:histone deacetylase [Candidatus Lokiarchaeota archaeon]MBD3201925.1 histone deacetylase [Candidatus Lokiarchaeota archaeon]